jgi:hypothetical protein
MTVRRRHPKSVMIEPCWIFLVNQFYGGCQEQIELSGLLANELSAFLFLDERWFRTGAERRTNASLTHAEELSIVIFRGF